MNRVIYNLISIWFIVLLCHVSCTAVFSNFQPYLEYLKKENILQCAVYSCKKIATIKENDIKEFRAKSYVESINELKDLDSNLTDVIEILDKIKELEKKGFDLLNTVPDNGATCSVQVKFYITAIIDRAKEQCDYCIEIHVNKENPVDMNVSWRRKSSYFIVLLTLSLSNNNFTHI